MIHVVSDNKIIVTIQGIRNVTWGESASYNIGTRGQYFLTITYKGSSNTFYYETHSDVKEMFTKIRDAMHSTRKQVTS